MDAMSIEKQINNINYTTNKEIDYLPDDFSYWQTPGQTEEAKTGDCEDIALLKLKRISNAGIEGAWIQECRFFDKSALVRHIVCCISVLRKRFFFSKPKQVILVLDNRTNHIYTQEQCEYEYWGSKLDLKQCYKKAGK